MILGVAIFFLVLAVDLFTDVRLFYKKKKVNHTRGLILRLIGLAPGIYLLGWLVIPAMGFLYLILFNGFYNVLIGQRWGFIGSTAKLDRLQAKVPKWIKYAGFVVFLLIYLKYGPAEIL